MIGLHNGHITKPHWLIAAQVMTPQGLQPVNFVVDKHPALVMLDHMKNRNPLVITFFSEIPTEVCDVILPQLKELQDRAQLVVPR